MAHGLGRLAAFGGIAVLLVCLHVLNEVLPHEFEDFNDEEHRCSPDAQYEHYDRWAECYEEKQLL